MNKLVYENLYETRNDILKEITSLNDTEFNESPGMNKWSIAQVCHHLVLVEEATLKAVSWGLKEGVNTQKERKNVHLILNRKNKIKAPKMVEPDVEPFTVQSIIHLLNNSRNKLFTFLDTIEDKSILMEKSVKHPALGELPLDQWIEQIYLHEQRHLEQMKEIKLLIDAGQ